MSRMLLRSLADWIALWVALSIALTCGEAAGCHATNSGGDTRMHLNLKDALMTQAEALPLADLLPIGSQITSVGPAVVDTYVELIERLESKQQKHDCTFRRTLGGGAWNIDLQLRRLGVKSRAVLLLGDDDLGRLVAERIDEKSPDAVVASVLELTREGFILDGECFTVRSGVADRLAELPLAAASTIADAIMIIMAPMLPKTAPTGSGITSARKPAPGRSRLARNVTAALLAQSGKPMPNHYGGGHGWNDWLE